MTPEQLLKIEEAATHCLSRCDNSHLPFTTVPQFIEKLKTNPTWTDREIIEMQSRVIAVMLGERGGRIE